MNLFKTKQNRGFTPTPSLALLPSFLVKFLRTSNYTIKTFFTSFTKRSNKKTMSNWVSGFTLVELLVTMAIIGVILSVVITSVSQARVKSRDSNRKIHLAQIQVALNSYYDVNNSYPIVKWATSETTTYDSGAVKWAQLQTALLPYLNKLPGDPKPAGTSGPWYTGNYHYAYGSEDGTTYDLVAQLEDTGSRDRCELKLWKYHSGETGIPPETVWCGGLSKYMYADH